MPQWASFDEVGMTTFSPISLVSDLLVLTLVDLDSNPSQDGVYFHTVEFKTLQDGKRQP